jgi:hypothetical protein
MGRHLGNSLINLHQYDRIRQAVDESGMDLDVKELEKSWKSLIKQLNQTFDADLDIQGVLFLIGVQELGQGYRQFKKDEKVDLMHLAICTVLMPTGYYEFVGRDEDGWPHFELKKPLPELGQREQEHLMKEAILEYFSQDEVFRV